MWDALANLLAQECRVVCYDQRGHGSSDATPGPYAMADLADDAARLLRELDSDPVVWIGLSMGGMVGQELTLRHPSLVAALIVANTSSHYPDAARAIWHERIATVREQGINAIADAVMACYFHDAFCAAEAATVARFMRRLVGTSADGYVACCAAVAGVDTRTRLARIAVPTLAIAGALDAGTPLAMLEAIAAAVPNAQLKTINGASHLSVIEQPAQFAQIVTDFMLGL